MALDQINRVEILSKLYKTLGSNSFYEAAELVGYVIDWDHPNSLMRTKIVLWKAIKSNGYVCYGVYQRKINVDQLKRAYTEFVRIAKRYGADL